MHYCEELVTRAGKQGLGLRVPPFEQNTNSCFGGPIDWVTNPAHSDWRSLKLIVQYFVEQLCKLGKVPFPLLVIQSLPVYLHDWTQGKMMDRSRWLDLRVSVSMCVCVCFSLGGSLEPQRAGWAPSPTSKSPGISLPLAEPSLRKIPRGSPEAGLRLGVCVVISDEAGGITDMENVWKWGEDQTWASR